MGMIVIPQRSTVKILQKQRRETKHVRLQFGDFSGVFMDAPGGFGDDVHIRTRADHHGLFPPDGQRAKFAYMVALEPRKSLRTLWLNILPQGAQNWTRASLVMNVI